MDPDLMRMAQGTPVSTWVLIIGLVTYAFTQLPKVTESGGNALTKWLEAKRRTSEIKDDADIADMQRQITNLVEELARLRTEVDGFRAEIRRRDTVLNAHMVWDVTAYRTIVTHLGFGVIDPPPGLWPGEPEASLERRPTPTPEEGTHE